MLIHTFDEFTWEIKLLLIQTNVDSGAAFSEVPHAGEEGMGVIVVVVEKITTGCWGESKRTEPGSIFCRKKRGK